MALMPGTLYVISFVLYNAVNIDITALNFASGKTET